MFFFFTIRDREVGCFEGLFLFHTLASSVWRNLKCIKKGTHLENMCFNVVAIVGLNKNEALGETFSTSRFLKYFDFFPSPTTAP